MIEPEEYAALTDEELFALIENGLMVNEGISDGAFRSNRRAEYLERAIYVCPYCGLSEFHSSGNEIECKKCHREIEYGTDKKLTGVGFSFPFEYVTEWYDYQKEYVNSLDVMQYTREPLFRDNASLSEVIVYKHKQLLRKQADITLYGDRILIDEGSENALVFPFADVAAVSVLGRNKLNIYHDDKVYQIKGGKRFNALKYVNICFRCKNTIRGDLNGKFLGL